MRIIFWRQFWRQQNARLQIPRFPRFPPGIPGIPGISGTSVTKRLKLGENGCNAPPNDAGGARSVHVRKPMQMARRSACTAGPGVFGEKVWLATCWWLALTAWLQLLRRQKSFFQSHDHISGLRCRARVVWQAVWLVSSRWLALLHVTLLVEGGVVFYRPDDTASGRGAGLSLRRLIPAGVAQGGLGLALPGQGCLAKKVGWRRAGGWRSPRGCNCYGGRKFFSQPRPHIGPALPGQGCFGKTPLVSSVERSPTGPGAKADGRRGGSSARTECTQPRQLFLRRTLTICNAAAIFDIHASVAPTARAGAARCLVVTSTAPAASICIRIAVLLLW